jgi:hypothetical protein
MLRKLTFVLALVAVAGFVAAQTTLPISPTDQGKDTFSIGTTDASVKQTVTLSLPQATALHLASTEITFDLTSTGPGFYSPDNTAGLRCVYVEGPDEKLKLGDEFYNQTQVIPGGIAYTAAVGAWDQISIAGELVTSYPPIKIVDGALDPDSKDYFVCYQSFVLQLFANYADWELTVERDDMTKQGIEHLYVQANTCAAFGTPTGLYDLPDGHSRNLIPTNLNNASTGDLSADSTKCNANSSWHDVLGVLAVKVNSDTYGDNVANLTYTLLAPGY